MLVLGIIVGIAAFWGVGLLWAGGWIGGGLHSKTSKGEFYGTHNWLTGETQIHRLDGPAIIAPFGNRYWFKNDQLHREDGPAIEYAAGDVEYWCRGVKYDHLSGVCR